MTTNSNEIRAFIAIELPEDILQRIAQIQSSLKLDAYRGLKWVKPDNIHVTLKFLGNIKESKITGICNAIEKAAHGIPPFNIGIAGLGVFPSLRRPRIIWIGITGETTKLIRIQNKIDMLLERENIDKEDRAFIPHLTICRIKESLTTEEIAQLTERIAKTQTAEQITFPVTDIVLIKSQLTKTGPIYSKLATIQLATK